MGWISTKIRFPKAGEQVLAACKNMNIKDGIWLYDLCYYYPNTGWENRVNWEDVLYWAYIDEPKLEVKEVDLEKELNDFIEQQKAYIKDDRVVEYSNGDSFNHIYDLEEIAKHFFELGLKVQKGE